MKGYDIICISSIDWDFIWQGHQEIMSTLAKNGNRVLFIENTGVRMPGPRDFSRIRDRIVNWCKGIKGIRKENDNLYIFSPVILPFPYSRIARFINKSIMLSILNKWMKAMSFSNPIVWMFLPTPLSVDIAGNIFKKILVYYCIDNFSASSNSAKKIKKSEEELLKKSDIVFATSEKIEARCSVYNKKVYRFPFGVSLEHFEKARRSEEVILKDFENISRPIVGYVGGVHKWVDQALVKYAAERHPDYSFVFVGPIQADISSLRKIKNIYFLGQKQHKDVPYFVKNFDVGIIPYLMTEYTYNVYPTKLNEYLSLGKTVVSINLPEIVLFNKEFGEIVHIAENRESFSRLLDDALKDNEKGIEDERIRVSSENNWKNRIEKMSGIIIDEINKKSINTEIQWKERFLKFCRTTRGSFFKAVLYFSVFFLLLFKTPMIWFIAEPLKIGNEPQKADLIMVFGGGVGEGGSPGKSTIERARYAVELYNNGYADNILFSSGYAYRYNDAENMKIFAVSLGVPAQNIILEQKANSAYENVMLSNIIVDRKGWSKVLLVSSPYNMLRVKLVFDKIAKEKKVFFTPVPDTQFYGRDEGVKLEQIKAVLHEYMGIVYYFLKGYL